MVFFWKQKHPIVKQLSFILIYAVETAQLYSNQKHESIGIGLPITKQPMKIDLWPAAVTKWRKMCPGLRKFFEGGSVYALNKQYELERIIYNLFIICIFVIQCDTHEIKFNIWCSVGRSPPPPPPMGGGSKGSPPPCGVGVVCGIVVVYRFPPPLWCGGGL